MELGAATNERRSDYDQVANRNRSKVIKSGWSLILVALEKNLFVLQSIVSKGCLIPNFVYEFFLIAVDEKIMVTFDFIRFSEPFFRLSI